MSLIGLPIICRCVCALSICWMVYCLASRTISYFLRFTFFFAGLTLYLDFRPLHFSVFSPLSNAGKETRDSIPDCSQTEVQERIRWLSHCFLPRRNYQVEFHFVESSNVCVSSVFLFVLFAHLHCFGTFQWLRNIAERYEYWVVNDIEFPNTKTSATAGQKRLHIFSSSQ